VDDKNFLEMRKLCKVRTAESDMKIRFSEQVLLLVRQGPECWVCESCAANINDAACNGWKREAGEYVQRSQYEDMLDQKYSSSTNKVVFSPFNFAYTC
jgi:hypothetical protein